MSCLFLLGWFSSSSPLPNYVYKGDACVVNKHHFFLPRQHISMQASRLAQRGRLASLLLAGRHTQTPAATVLHHKIGFSADRWISTTAVMQKRKGGSKALMLHRKNPKPRMVDFDGGRDQEKEAQLSMAEIDEKRDTDKYIYQRIYHQALQRRELLQEDMKMMAEALRSGFVFSRTRSYLLPCPLVPPHTVMLALAYRNNHSFPNPLLQTLSFSTRRTNSKKKFSMVRSLPCS